ncbi:MAG TPA: hypothetical protein VLG38_04780, partial [Gammaproteobacteria bacterium]|nr:hypothetical protein [Gammaproteobacteria bacterium]
MSGNDLELKQMISGINKKLAEYGLSIDETRPLLAQANDIVNALLSRIAPNQSDNLVAAFPPDAGIETTNNMRAQLITKCIERLQTRIAQVRDELELANRANEQDLMALNAINEAIATHALFLRNKAHALQLLDNIMNAPQASSVTRSELIVTASKPFVQPTPIISTPVETIADRSAATTQELINDGVEIDIDAPEVTPQDIARENRIQRFMQQIHPTRVTTLLGHLNATPATRVIEVSANQQLDTPIDASTKPVIETPEIVPQHAFETTSANIAAPAIALAAAAAPIFSQPAVAPQNVEEAIAQSSLASAAATVPVVETYS